MHRSRNIERIRAGVEEEEGKEIRKVRQLST
jgi:hypothetical protein